MKKLTIGLAVLLSGFAANSFAALPTGTSRCDVSVPSYCGGFTFGLTGLYWRASSSGEDFANTFPGADFSFTPTTPFDAFTSLGSGDRRHHRYDYDWGFKANVGYIFPCSGNDINLTYTHWDHDHHRNVDLGEFALPPVTSTVALLSSGPLLTFTNGVATATALLPLAAILSDPAFTVTDFATAVSDRVDTENHTWDLDFGQTINAGCNFKVRFFGGLRYSRLEHKQDTTFVTAFSGTSAPTPGVVITGDQLIPVTPPTAIFGGAAALPVALDDVTVTDIFHRDSKFDGIGPRFGFDVAYHFGGGFGLVGNLSTSLLVGEIDNTFADRVVTDGVFTLLGAPVPATGITLGFPVGLPAALIDPAVGVATPFGVDSGDLSFHHPDHTRVVPNIDAKIGLDWTYQFCNCSRTKLTIEAGYLVSHYFNAIDRTTAVEALNPEVSPNHTLDLSFDGPYVSVQVAL